MPEFLVTRITTHTVSADNPEQAQRFARWMRDAETEDYQVEELTHSQETEPVREMSAGPISLRQDVGLRSRCGERR
jgi:hypothetical protein